MDRKTALLDLLEYTYTQECAFAEGLSPSERVAMGDPQRWAAKDNLAHCAAWQARLASNLKAVAAGRPTQHNEDVDRVNEETFLAHQNDDLDKALLNLKHAYEGLSGQTRLLSDDELASLEILPWQHGRPLWRLIAGNGAIHPFVHMATYQAQNGRAQQAVRLYRAAMPRFSALDRDPGWQGLVQYDLACVNALAGQKSRAIGALKKALRLVPELTDWARQDTDLINLREETEFRALFKD